MSERDFATVLDALHRGIPMAGHAWRAETEAALERIRTRVEVMERERDHWRDLFVRADRLKDEAEAELSLIAVRALAETQRHE